MKAYVIIFVSFCSLALADPEFEVDQESLRDLLNIGLQEFKVDVPKELADALQLDLESNGGRGGGGITANINDYTDKLITNFQKFLIRQGHDPTELPDTTLKLVPTGTIALTSGWLQDTSTISRNGDVTVSYSTSNKKMEISVPIKFDVLLFTYRYHTKALLLSIKGGAEGKVTNLKINVVLSFNFGSYQASLDKFNFKDTGKISLKFTGNGLIDWLTNAMTSVVTIFLKPIIINIIQSIVKGTLTGVVDAVNQLIESILNPGIENVASYLV